MSVHGFTKIKIVLMKKSFLPFLFSCVLSTHCVMASEGDTLDLSYFSQKRLGKVLTKHTQDLPEESILPTFQGPKEVIDFVRAFYKGEQEFWQDTQADFRNKNTRLNKILTIVENAIKKLPPNSPNFIKSSTKTEALLSIFSASTVTEADKLSYDLYKSYEETITYFGEFNEIFSTLEQQKNVQIENAKSTILSFILKKEKHFALKKGLLKASGVKSINDMLKNTPQYHVCDLEKLIISSRIMFLRILNNDNIKTDNHELRRPHPLPQPQTKHKKKKKKNRKKLPIRSNSTPISSAGEAPPLPAKDLGLIEVKEVSSKETILEEKFVSLPHNISVVPEIENIQSQEKETLFEATFNPLLEKTEEDVSLDPSLLRPWEQYPKKTSKSRTNDGETPTVALVVSSSESHNIDPTIEQTLLSFFSTKQDHVNANVSMGEFLSLISSYFNGYVYRIGENLHFMAKHNQTNKWHSTCMHVLHKDKSHSIPRNTFYWKRAKSLLEQLEADKLLTDGAKSLSFPLL